MRTTNNYPLNKWDYRRYKWGKAWRCET